MLQMQIVIGNEFKGLSTGIEVRYIGLLTELYKRYSLSIFAPGDTSVVKSLFPNANVCKSTPAETPKKLERTTIWKEWFFPSHYSPLLTSFKYNQYFANIVAHDTNKYDVSLYFGKSTFIRYGSLTINECVFCDFCDSDLRHLRNAMHSTSNLRKIISLYLDKIYIIRQKKKYIPPNLRIIAITDLDSRCITSVLNNNTVYTVPNGVNMINIEEPHSLLQKKFHSLYIIFLGNLDYEPNISSIVYTLKNLWPEIHGKFPHINFRIIGKSPSDSLKKRVAQEKGVELVGPVENVNEYYLNSKLFIGPIFTGGGLKNKFLEALASGTPIITTQEGAEGISGFISNKHGKIGLSKKDFLRGVHEILSSSLYEYSQYVENCRTLAKSFSWQSIGLSLDRIIKSELGIMHTKNKPV